MSSRVESSVANVDLGASAQASHAAWWMHLLWILAACVVGFAVAAIFAGIFHMPRRWFLAPHVVVSGSFVYAYLRWSGLSLIELSQPRWILGVVVGVLAGAFLVMNVLSQPASPRSAGALLVFDLLWLGLIYGLVDALLLSVMPILATWEAFSILGWVGSWPGKIAVGALALLMSLLVTAAYHLGYPEFKGPEVVGPLIGNGVSSLAYLLSGNPLGSLISHVAMHIASVLHGPATTIQLPPHY